MKKKYMLGFLAIALLAGGWWTSVASLSQFLDDCYTPVSGRLRRI
jgi:hypothetical protein